MIAIQKLYTNDLSSLRYFYHKDNVYAVMFEDEESGIGIALPLTSLTEYKEVLKKYRGEEKSILDIALIAKRKEGGYNFKYI